jgi:hypothetical protein
MGVNTHGPFVLRTRQRVREHPRRGDFTPTGLFDGIVTVCVSDFSDLPSRDPWIPFAYEFEFIF